MANGPLGAATTEPAQHRIPWEWQHIVCTCPEDQGTKHDLDTYGPFMVCRACGKYKRFYASHCTLCHSFYLIVFWNPVWSPLKNWCWTCMLTLGTYDGIKIIPPMPIVKPQKRLTREEIDKGLDDFFSTVVDLDNSVDPFNF